jgi:hypothetical protein
LLIWPGAAAVLGLLPLPPVWTAPAAGSATPKSV